MINPNYVQQQIAYLKNDKIDFVNLPYELSNLYAYSEVLPNMPDIIKVVAIDISEATNGEQSEKYLQQYKEALRKCLISFNGLSSTYTLVISEAHNAELATAAKWNTPYPLSAKFKLPSKRAILANKLLQEVLPALSENANVTAIEFMRIPVTYYTDITLFVDMFSVLKSSSVNTINLNFREIFSAHEGNKEKCQKFLFDLASSLQDTSIHTITLNYSHIIPGEAFYERYNFLKALQSGIPNGVTLDIKNTSVEIDAEFLLSKIQQSATDGVLLYHDITLPTKYSESKEEFIELLKQLESNKKAINFFTSALLWAAEIDGYYRADEDLSLEEQQKYHIDRIGIAINRFIDALKYDTDQTMSNAIKGKLAMLSFELNNRALDFEDSKEYGKLLQYIDRVCATVGADIKQAAAFKQSSFANADKFPKANIPTFKNYCGPSKPRYIR